MGNHIIPDFTLINFISSIALAPLFIILMSLVKEPTRQKLNAVIIGFAGGAYYSGGLGIAEYFFGMLLIFMAVKGLTNYNYIGIAWLFHTIWDVIHHFGCFGGGIFPFIVAHRFNAVKPHHRNRPIIGRQFI